MEFSRPKFAIETVNGLASLDLLDESKCSAHSLQTARVPKLVDVQSAETKEGSNNIFILTLLYLTHVVCFLLAWWGVGQWCAGTLDIQITVPFYSQEVPRTVVKKANKLLLGVLMPNSQI
ncbi:hypothetical protein M8C21_033064 [Ambrosia artemisiifolia]|uniref:Uncharacterized protein n=1 Tax=Ambrosia artemisiifolia TaxID=4212 RepID=A0AAD5CX10_AMBAR|nr:hypothetical protein M8C21_033064 [Ambrosia artemisiifolia]